MLSGFNTNLRHRGVLFHVQTEDSGRANPHIISHLFHGGNILVSKKSEYRDMLDKDDVDAEVRGMMEAQHKAILRGLIKGESDERIIARLGPDIFEQAATDTEPELSTPSTEPLELEAEPVALDPEPVALDAEAIVSEDPAAHAVDDPKERLTRAFGDSVVSQKPLDEVVLDYLVQSARKRKRPPT